MTLSPTLGPDPVAWVAASKKKTQKKHKGLGLALSMHEPCMMCGFATIGRRNNFTKNITWDADADRKVISMSQPKTLLTFKTTMTIK